MSSNVNLLDSESIYGKQLSQQKGESTIERDEVRGKGKDKRQVNININSKGANPCCCLHGCFSFFYFISKIFKCFKMCCCTPCCSTAALLGGMSALGGILAGCFFMGVFGIIPIPMELTKLICNASEAQKFYYYHNNLTIIKEIGNYNFTNPSIFYSIKMIATLKLITLLFIIL